MLLLNCAFTRTSKIFNISPVLKSLHWLKINERIKIPFLPLSHCLSYLQSSPHYSIPVQLRCLLSIQPARSSYTYYCFLPSLKLHFFFVLYTPILRISLPKEFHQAWYLDLLLLLHCDTYCLPVFNWFQFLLNLTVNLAFSSPIHIFRSLRILLTDSPVSLYLGYGFSSH
jgi:hypothetical protein